MQSRIKELVPPTKVILISAGSDVVTYNPPLRAISVGTAGNVKVTDLEGNTVTIPSNALAAGIQHIMQITQVWATGTTASEIVGWR